MHHYGGQWLRCMAWLCQSIIVVDGAFDSMWPCNVDAFMTANKCVKIGETR